MNVQFDRETLTQLCDEAVVNLFWSRVQSGQSVLLADELATVQLSDPALVAFFKVDASSSPINGSRVTLKASVRIQIRF